MINLSTFAQDFLVWLGIVPSNRGEGNRHLGSLPVGWFLLERYYYSDCICSISFKPCLLNESSWFEENRAIIHDNRFFLIRYPCVRLLNSNVESISFNYRYLVRNAEHSSWFLNKSFKSRLILSSYRCSIVEQSCQVILIPIPVGSSSSPKHRASSTFQWSETRRVPIYFATLEYLHKHVTINWQHGCKIRLCLKYISRCNYIYNLDQDIRVFPFY